MCLAPRRYGRTRQKLGQEEKSHCLQSVPVIHNIVPYKNGMPSLQHIQKSYEEIFKLELLPEMALGRG